MNKFSVAYGLDQNYLAPFGCSVHSLLTYNNNLVDQIFVLHDSQLMETKKFHQVKEFLLQKFGKKVNSVIVDSGDFENLKIDNHLSVATYYKLMIPFLLPEKLDSILSLDCDTIVTNRLPEFYDNIFKSTPGQFACAVDHELPQNEIDHLKKISPIKKYFNAGVIFMNLKLIRSNFDTNGFLEFSSKYSTYLTFHDQDVLNVHFQDKWIELPYEYNGFGLEEKVNHIPLIIHYTGNRKPWNLICDHPYKKSYWMTLKQTPLYSFSARFRQLISPAITVITVPAIIALRQFLKECCSFFI